MLRIGYRLCVAAMLLSSAAAAEQRLASGYRNYSIRLTAWRPASMATAGVLVPVRINDGRTLRLLLDSGAAGIVLSERTARELGLEAIAEGRIVGLGDGAARKATSALARTVSIGELQFSDAVVQVLPEHLTREADGIIGMKVFEAFRIRLDAPARELRLEAFAEPAPLHNAEAGHLLYVRAKINGNSEGLFLVDTGSAVTSLGNDLRWPAAPAGGTLTLEGAGGQIGGAKKLAPVSLEIGGKRVIVREPIALNLDSISHHSGVKVAGILGYSSLSKVPVTFNYRDGLVELGPH